MNGIFGVISDKFRIFDIASFFCNSSKFSFLRPVGGIFVYLSKIRNFYHIDNQFARKISTFYDRPYVIAHLICSSDTSRSSCSSYNHPDRSAHTTSGTMNHHLALFLSKTSQTTRSLKKRKDIFCIIINLSYCCYLFPFLNR